MKLTNTQVQLLRDIQSGEKGQLGFEIVDEFGPYTFWWTNELKDIRRGSKQHDAATELMDERHIWFMPGSSYYLGLTRKALTYLSTLDNKDNEY